MSESVDQISRVLLVDIFFESDCSENVLQHLQNEHVGVKVIIIKEMELIQFFRQLVNQIHQILDQNLTEEGIHVQARIVLRFVAIRPTEDIKELLEILRISVSP
jgi:hypothetical protein